MKTRVLERAKSNLLLLCASFVTVKNMVLNSYECFKSKVRVTIPIDLL